MAGAGWDWRTEERNIVLHFIYCFKGSSFNPMVCGKTELEGAETDSYDERCCVENNSSENNTKDGLVKVARSGHGD